MNRFALLLPFHYSWVTRLREGTVAFHVLFEWLAAAVLVVALNGAGSPRALYAAVLAYLAFVCVYEIGYLTNDLIVAPREPDGRLRGPQGAAAGWIAAWMLARVLVFVLATAVAGHFGDLHWWGYFAALAVIFAGHNFLHDKELKAGTFLWLSWFRFMAPVAFAVPSMYVLGIGLGCAMTYSAFREMAYLDGKGMLKMPGRRRLRFRWLFFMWPLLPAAMLHATPGARGFVILACYYALVASLGTLAYALRRNRGEVA